MKALHIVGRIKLAVNFKAESSSYYLDQVKQIVSKSGLTIVGEAGLFNFEGGGFTMFVMLAESHVSMHTWYELGFVDLDVFTCGISKDNSDAGREVFQKVADLFNPITVENRQEIDR